MIKNYKQFESLLNKLQGPTKEEMWKNYGYDKIFNTSEEFFLYVIDGLKIKEQDEYPNLIFWEKSGKILFEQCFENNVLYVNNSMIWKVFENIFNMTDNGIQNWLKYMVKKHLNWDRLRPYEETSTHIPKWDDIK